MNAIWSCGFNSNRGGWASDVAGSCNAKNSEMNVTRDALGDGIGFSTPVAVNGRVVTTYDTRLGIFGLLH